MSHVYPDPIQGPNSPLAKSFSYEPMPHCPQLVFNQVELRDYFAAAALPVAWNAYDSGYFGDTGHESANHAVATAAYQMADAMIKAREAK